MPTPDPTDSGLSFDPLAVLEEMAAAPPPTPADDPPACLFEIPFSLDVLAAGQAPGETPQDLIARAVAAARVQDEEGPTPARAVRTPSPLYDDRNPRLPPYPFDGSDHRNTTAVAVLALPASDHRAALERSAAARRLVREYEAHARAPLSLPDALIWWWKAARRCVDVAECLGLGGRSPNAVRLRAFRYVAPDFADALMILPSARARAFEDAGIPMARDKKGKPTGSGEPPAFIL